MCNLKDNNFGNESSLSVIEEDVNIPDNIENQIWHALLLAVLE